MAGWKLATLLNGQSSHHRLDTVVHTLLFDIMLPAENKERQMFKVSYIQLPLKKIELIIILGITD